MQEEKRSASVHVNFRIPIAYKEALEKGASEQGTSLNAFVNRIFAKFVSFDRMMDDSQRIVLHRHFVDRMISSTSIDDIDEVARNLGTSVLKPALVFSGRIGNMNDMVKNYFIPMGTYSGWFRANSVKTSSEHKLILQHEYGPKWTLFLNEYYSVAIESLGIRGVHFNSSDGILEITYP